MGYGDGLQDVEPNHAFGSSWRDSTGNSNYDYPERHFTSRPSGVPVLAATHTGSVTVATGSPKPTGVVSEAISVTMTAEIAPTSIVVMAAAGMAGREWPDLLAIRHLKAVFTMTAPAIAATETGGTSASDEVSSWFGDEDAERRRQMDQTRGHRGRGPKNYTRSDERIREDINDRLTDHDHLDASNIEVAVQGSDVTLTGTVNTRYEKRLAEDIADDISGVSNVENRIRVENEQQRFSSAGMQNAPNASQTTMPQTDTGTTTTSQAKSRSTST